MASTAVLLAISPCELSDHVVAPATEHDELGANRFRLVGSNGLPLSIRRGRSHGGAVPCSGTYGSSLGEHVTQAASSTTTANRRRPSAPRRRALRQGHIKPYSGDLHSPRTARPSTTLRSARRFWTTLAQVEKDHSGPDHPVRRLFQDPDVLQNMADHRRSMRSCPFSSRVTTTTSS